MNLIDREYPLDILVHQIILPLFSIIYQVLELLHLNFDYDLIDGPFSHTRPHPVCSELRMTTHFTVLRVLLQSWIILRIPITVIIFVLYFDPIGNEKPGCIKLRVLHQWGVGIHNTWNLLGCHLLYRIKVHIVWCFFILDPLWVAGAWQFLNLTLSPDQLYLPPSSIWRIISLRGDIIDGLNQIQTLNKMAFVIKLSGRLSDDIGRCLLGVMILPISSSAQAVNTRPLNRININILLLPLN